MSFFLCVTAATLYGSLHYWWMIFAPSMSSRSFLRPGDFCWITNSGFWEDFLSTLNNSDARQKQYMLPGNISMTEGHGWHIESCFWMARSLWGGEKKVSHFALAKNSGISKTQPLKNVSFAFWVCFLLFMMYISFCLYANNCYSTLEWNISQLKHTPTEKAFVIQLFY